MRLRVFDPAVGMKRRSPFLRPRFAMPARSVVAATNDEPTPTDSVLSRRAATNQKSPPSADVDSELRTRA